MKEQVEKAVEFLPKFLQDVIAELGLDAALELTLLVRCFCLK